MKSKIADTPPASIAAVERDTGLSKDTLRVWERRYGFPRPLRDSNGERVYPSDQLEKLRVIRRLMDGGVRPKEVVTLPLHVLNGRAKTLPQRQSQAGMESPMASAAMRLLQAHEVNGLRGLLTHGLVQFGLQRFVMEVVAPLNEIVGDAWIEGRIQIFEEHLYAEQVQQMLRQAIAALTQRGDGPRVLLTTLPGERHKLGLLMAEACLTVEGAQCISLGVETPAPDIALAARAHDVDIVGLSFSAAVAANVARKGLADVRNRLDPKVALWAGGSLWQHTRKTVPGVTTVAALTAIADALKAWRESAARH